MAFQSELKVKSQIIEAVGTEQLFKLLSDQDSNILMKTLGLIRNLLSGKTVSTVYLIGYRYHRGCLQIYPAGPKLTDKVCLLYVMIQKA